MEQKFSNNSIDLQMLRVIIAEHILFQFRSRYLDLHCATARERYELLFPSCAKFMIIIFLIIIFLIKSFVCI